MTANTLRSRLAVSYGPAVAYGSDPLATALYRAALLAAERILGDRDRELTIGQLVALETALADIYAALRRPLP
jgi:hypothetical protein